MQVATFLAVALLATVLVPLQVASADDNPTPDGFIILVEPTGGDLRDGQLFMDAVSGVYSFHVSVYDAVDGLPIDITNWGAVVVGPEAAYANVTETDLCSASRHPGCIFTTGGTNPDADNTFTIKISAAALALGGEIPGNTIGLYVVLHSDGAGNSLASADAGRPPTGYYNPATEAFFLNGDFAAADAADEAGYPIVLRNAFVQDLIQPGNPVLNPGFEVAQGAALPGELSFPSEDHGFSSEIAPWFLFIDSGAGTSTTPASTHFLATNCNAPGESGSCASIHVDSADFGDNLIFGQFFAPPGSGLGVWRVGDNLGLEFDTRTSNDYDWRATATVHYLDALTGAEQQQTRSLSSGVPGGYDWTHVAHDFDIPSGSILTSFFFSLNWAWNGAPIVLFDNVELTGATLDPQPNLQNDFTDGYSAFIYPLGASAGAGGVVSQNIQSLNGGDYYVYEVAAESYLGEGATPVKMADGLPFHFEILKQDYLADGARTGHDSLYEGPQYVKLVDADGTVQDTVYVLVPASVVSEATRVFPWVFKDVITGDEYTDTFGYEADPVSAYHSILRNALRGEAVADVFDSASTPVVLTNNIGGSLTKSTAITLDCPGVSPGQACLSDPTPLLVANLTTDSRVLETYPVDLVAASNPDLVLATGNIQAPGGSLEFQLSQESMDLLRNEGTDLRVFARTTGGLFAAPAESEAIRLDNLIPVADFTFSPGSDLTSLTRITVQDDSVDLDGAIERRTWKVRFLTDPTDDADDQIEGTTVVAYPQGTSDTNLRSFSFRAPDDGQYEIVLTSQDNDGAYSTVNKTFTVNNMAPVGSIRAAVYAQPNMPLPFETTLVDPDGGLIDQSSIAWSVGSGNATITTTATGATLLFADDGEHTVTVSFLDDDGASGSASHTIIIDGVGPKTTISVPAAPSTGWFTSPVEVSFTRSDDRSGVRSTMTTIDGGSFLARDGDADFSRMVTTEGEHVIAAFSQDKALNTGSVATASVKIDTAKPTVQLTNEGPLPFYTFFRYQPVTLTASASDTASGVKQVSFFYEGRVIGTDTDGSDGWSVEYDPANDTGYGEITAVAVDHAGHSALSEGQQAFIFDIGS